MYVQQSPYFVVVKFKILGTNPIPSIRQDAVVFKMYALNLMTKLYAVYH